MSTTMVERILPKTTGKARNYAAAWLNNRPARTFDGGVHLWWGWRRCPHLLAETSTGISVCNTKDIPHKHLTINLRDVTCSTCRRRAKDEPVQEAAPVPTPTPSAPPPLQRYKKGSRVQKVWEVFRKDGADAAHAFGSELQLSPNTVKGWVRMWSQPA